MANRKEIARRFGEEVYGKHRLEVANELCTGDYVMHDPIVGTGGIDLLKSQMKEMFEAFPDFKPEFYEMLEDGDLVSVHWRVNCTHDGPFAGVEPTGKKCSFGGMSLFRFEGDQIAEEWDHYDALGLMRQIGAVELEEEEFARPSGEAPQPQA